MHVHLIPHTQAIHCGLATFAVLIQQTMRTDLRFGRHIFHSESICSSWGQSQLFCYEEARLALPLA